MTMDPKTSEILRRPFAAADIDQLPRGGVMLDYVGHAAITHRLLEADPDWTWEPVAYGPDGVPAIVTEGKESVLWIRLTVGGVTRLGVGSCPPGQFDAAKVLVGDALRNAAMRFGVALDLWRKDAPQSHEDRPRGDMGPARLSDTPPAPERPTEAEMASRRLNAGKSALLIATAGDKAAAAALWDAVLADHPGVDLGDAATADTLRLAAEAVAVSEGGA